MTVTFAGAFVDCAAIGADTLGHDAKDPETQQRRRKIYRLNKRVVMAKGGYGPEADGVFHDMLSWPDIDGAGPSEAAAQIQKTGKRIYEHCKQLADINGVDDPGLYLLVAGREESGAFSIHWLDFKKENFGSDTGPGKCIAIGPDPDLPSVATRLIGENAEIEPPFVVGALDQWAIDLTNHCKKKADHAIGFPVELFFVNSDGVEGVFEIKESDEPQAQFRRRIVPLKSKPSAGCPEART